MFGKSKYKRITTAVFPDKEGDGIVSHEVGNLLHYAATTPSKLPKIGKLLEKRGKLELEKRHFGQVGVVMDAFNKLIDACHDHITMFAINCLCMTEACFLDPSPEVKIFAKETFVRFVSVENVGGHFQSASNLVTYLIKMAETPLDEALSVELRVGGLSGLQVFIAVVDDIDVLIRPTNQQSPPSSTTSPSDIHRLMRTVLDNLYMAFKQDPDLKCDYGEPIGEEGVGQTAMRCISNLASRLNNITVRTVTASLIRFIDDRNLWAPRAFALFVIRLALESIQRQHHYLVLSALLHHLESTSEPLIKTNLVYVISSIAQSSSSSSGMVEESMSLIVFNLKETLEMQGKHKEGEEEVNQLRKALINCMTVVIESAPDFAQKGEAFEYMIDCIKKERSGSSPPKSRNLLLRALRFQLDHILSLAKNQDCPIPVIELMLSLNLSDRAGSLSSQKLMNLILTHENAENLLGNPTQEGGALNQLRASLFKQIRVRTNEPENVAIILKNLVGLLHLYKAREVPWALPRLFGLQESANECDLPLSRSVHTSIGAYLFSIGKIFGIKPLQDYVLGVMDRRKKENQACRYLKMQKDGLLVATKKRYKEENLHEGGKEKDKEEKEKSKEKEKEKEKEKDKEKDKDKEKEKEKGKEKETINPELLFDREKITNILCSFLPELQGQKDLLWRVLPTEKSQPAKMAQEKEVDSNENWSVVVAPPLSSSLILQPSDLIRALEFHREMKAPFQKKSFNHLFNTLVEEKESLQQKEEDLDNFLTHLQEETNQPPSLPPSPLSSSSPLGEGGEGEGKEGREEERTTTVVFSSQCTLGLVFPAFCEVW